MDITRSRELTVRMGEYETYKFSARVHASHKDLGYTDELLLAGGDEVAEVANNLQSFVADQLDAALLTDIEDAAALTGDRKSFIRRATASAPASATTKKD